MAKSTPETRFQAKAQILARVRAGEAVTDICRPRRLPPDRLQDDRLQHGDTPQFPSANAVYAWTRTDPAFAAALAEARVAGAQARHARARRVDPAQARRFLSRYAGGEPLKALLADPHMPDRRALARWRQADPEFAAELSRLKADRRAEAVQRHAVRRHRPFDQAIADKVIVRLHYGATLRTVHKADPTLPGANVIRRWARENPEFAGVIRTCGQVWRGRRRGAAQTTLTPDVRARLLAGIAAGASLADLAREPGMPRPGRVWRWMRRWPDFAEEVAHAKTERDWTFHVQIEKIADRATLDTVDAAAQQIKAVQGRRNLLSRLGHHRPRKR